MEVEWKARIQNKISKHNRATLHVELHTTLNCELKYHSNDAILTVICGQRAGVFSKFTWLYQLGGKYSCIDKRYDAEWFALTKLLRIADVNFHHAAGVPEVFAFFRNNNDSATMQANFWKWIMRNPERMKIINNETMLLLIPFNYGILSFPRPAWSIVIGKSKHRDFYFYLACFMTP